MPMHLTLNAKSLQRYIDAGAKRWPNAASRELAKVGRLVFEESQREVPVGSTRVLIGSGSIYVAPHTVTIRYTAPYARYVHFRKKAKHPTGNWRFLYRPFTKGKRILRHAIVVAIQKAMDEGW